MVIQDVETAAAVIVRTAAAVTGRTGVAVTRRTGVAAISRITADAAIGALTVKAMTMVTVLDGVRAAMPVAIPASRHVVRQ